MEEGLGVILFIVSTMVRERGRQKKINNTLGQSSTVGGVWTDTMEQKKGDGNVEHERVAGTKI